MTGKPTQRSSIRARSGVTDRSGESARPIHATFHFVDGETVAVTVDLATFTIREDAQAREAIARLTPRDRTGRAIGEATLSQKVLAYAWVVLTRTRDVDFDDLCDALPRDGGLVVDVNPDIEEAPSPEG